MLNCLQAGAEGYIAFWPQREILNCRSSIILKNMRLFSFPYGIAVSQLSKTKTILLPCFELCYSSLFISVSLCYLMSTGLHVFRTTAEWKLTRR